MLHPKRSTMSIYTHKRGITMSAKVRININVSEEQKQTIQRRADAQSMTVTDYILYCTLVDQPKEEKQDNQTEMLREQIRLYQEQIAILKQSLEHTQKSYEDMSRMAQLLQMNALPFYKRIFSKTKGIENK